MLLLSKEVHKGVRRERGKSKSTLFSESANCSTCNSQRLAFQGLWKAGRKRGTVLAWHLHPPHPCPPLFQAPSAGPVLGEKHSLILDHLCFCLQCWCPPNPENLS